MELKEIYFDAFKTLLGKKLTIETPCIGFVGINESGKSNVLSAIHVLGGDRKLSPLDRPRWIDNIEPSIRYIFELSDAEKREFNTLINEWAKNYTCVKEELLTADIIISYHVAIEDDKEHRWFTIDTINLDPNYLFVKRDKLTPILSIKCNGEFIPMDKALIIDTTTLSANKELPPLLNELRLLDEHINSIETEHEQLLKELNEKDKSLEEIGTKLEAILKIEKEALTATDLEMVDQLERNKLEQQIKKQEVEARIEVTKKKLEEVSDKRNKIKSKIGDYDYNAIVKSILSEIDNLYSSIDSTMSDAKSYTTDIESLEAITPRTAAQEQTLSELKTEYTNCQKAIQEYENIKSHKEKDLAGLQEPIEDKYSTNVEELEFHLRPIIFDKLNSFLPKVVFWEYNPAYLLPDETLFSEILAKNDLREISRPLVNTFRIGAQIKDFKDLESLIKRIQQDPNQRSKMQKQMTKNIKKYLKAVWSDYDQEIEINLEKEIIRLQIHAKHEEASYYSMLERSQGCQTFISFLLTIGAEAQHGVIKNTILLLDEPETHLHPSGARFMLKELIRISKTGNIVFFATHSIHMIDRENYDRHIILEKEKEQTIIKPSSHNRVGYFMQEEVLYGTIDRDLRKDFNSSKDFNFVFEGEGDTTLFKHFYSNIISDNHRPFKLEKVNFHQGGKCTFIQKYFSFKPIQLGTKWIFVLDSDNPANKLAAFISGKYKQYLNNDIFIFQYGKDSGDPKSLEDMLPTDIIQADIEKTLKQKGRAADKEDIEKLMKSKVLFVEYGKDILDNDDLKSAFKENLNDTISKQLAEIRKEEFEKKFELYLKWAKGVTDYIQKALDTTMKTAETSNKSK